MSVETKQNKTYDKLVGTKRKGITLLFAYFHLRTFKFNQYSIILTIIRPQIT